MKQATALIIRVIDVVAGWCYGLAGFLMLVLMVGIVYEVVMRYFLMRPTIWAVDVSEYIVVYATLLAAPWLLKNKGHVRIVFLVNRLSPRAQALMGIVTAVMGALVCLVLLWQISEELWNSFQAGLMIEHPLRVPKWVTRAPIPLGSLLLSVYFLREVFTSYATLRVASNNRKRRASKAKT